MGVLAHFPTTPIAVIIPNNNFYFSQYTVDVGYPTYYLNFYGFHFSFLPHLLLGPHAKSPYCVHSLSPSHLTLALEPGSFNSLIALPNSFFTSGSPCALSVASFPLQNFKPLGVTT